MAAPVLEESLDLPNGTRTVFRSSADYKSGSIRVFINGQLITEDFWTELGGSKVRLADPPDKGEVVQLYYLR